MNKTKIPKPKSPAKYAADLYREGSFGSETITALGDHQSHIAKLLAELEEKKIDPHEVRMIKSATDSLMDQFEEHHIELQHEINQVLESFRLGLMTPEQLANILADHKKTEYALRAAEHLKTHLDTQYELLVDLIDTVESGSALDRTAVDSMLTGMNIMMDSVNSISKVMDLPATIRFQVF